MILTLLGKIDSEIAEMWCNRKGRHTQRVSSNNPHMSEKRRIAINTLSARQGGGQVYISHILRYAKEFPAIKVYVFTPPQFCSFYAYPGVEVVPCDTPSKSILHRMLWEKLTFPGILKRLRIDLLFCPGGIINTVPPVDCSIAVTFQNMLIFDYENRQKYRPGYVRLKLALLERISKKSFEEADLLIFISEFAKEIVCKNIPNRGGDSVVISHGLDDRFRTLYRKDIPRLNLLPNEDYLLYVSLITVYKAHIEVVRAYHSLCHKRPTKEKLLLVGPEYRPYGKLVRKEIKRLGLQDKVIITGEIPYSDMPSVYHYAKAHIFASSCENCPNIVLESLGSGRPLFLSNRPPMAEFADSSAIYFNPYDSEELARLMFEVIDDTTRLNELGNAAYANSLKYSWEATAQKIFQTFLDL